MENNKEITYGDKLMGRNFNVSEDSRVDKVKALFAKIVDIIEEDFKEKFHETLSSRESNVIRTSAVTSAMTAQMWAVKLLTWKN